MSEILFADIDSASVEDAVITTYEQIAGVTLHPADPVRLFLESIAYKLAVQNNVINLAGRQNLLAYATGEHLDYIGMMVGTARLGASFASCEQTFYLKAPLGFSVAIPAGTRVTTGDGKAIFATLEALEIPAGAACATGRVQALASGAQANGFVPGQVCQLVDPVAYIEKTANATVTLLGSDIESDERYRSRIQQAPEAFSCAGPVGAYRFYALASHPDISAVAVYSPEPGKVDIRPVLKGGELPPQDVLDDVFAAVNADNIRPLTDTVLVQAPELVEFDIDFTWYLASDRQVFLDTTRQAVADAVEEYRLWQRTQPGRDILPIRLASLLEQAGVKRIELKKPAYRKLEQWQLGREKTISVTFGGVES
ncbi:MAG: baseplate J/gp47 family protein [Desulfovibrio sp.]|nr:baseplate J/gp47 family protein [Desulfovibrio sp.]